MIGTSSEYHTISSGAPKGKVPSFLIREVLDGEPVYYKGYLDVLTGIKAFEEVMGDSVEKLAIIEYLVEVFLSGPGRNRFRIITNEAGLNIDPENDLSGDVQLFDANAFPVKKKNYRYATIPPVVHVEVDINTEMVNLSQEQYIQKKIETLLDFGTQKVIWIFSDTKSILIATPEGQRKVDWAEEVELTAGSLFNIGTFLNEYEEPAYP